MASYDDYDRDVLDRPSRYDKLPSTNAWWGFGLAAAVIVLFAVLIAGSHNGNTGSNAPMTPLSAPAASPETAPAAPNPSHN
jgi:hypothetical protein